MDAQLLLAKASFSMSLVAFELPSQVNQALAAFRQRRHVLIYCFNAPALNRSNKREHIRELLRQFLMSYAETSAVKLSIDNQRGVVPTILLNGRQIHVSISHAALVSCAALSLDYKIGVDLIDLNEIKESEDLLPTAKLFLSPDIATSLANSTGHEFCFNFGIEWAKREASLKCLGLPIIEWTQHDPCHLHKMIVEFMDIDRRYVLAHARLRV